MSNTKDNRRVQYTKAELKRSLLTLLRAKPIGKITVKEICETADLNRGTFYAYYSSPEMLLEEIEDEFYLDILNSVSAFRRPDDVVTIFTQALTALKERQELSEVLAGTFADGAFIEKLVDVARALCMRIWVRLSPHVPQKTLGMMYDFCSWGCAQVIEKWVQNGMKEEPEEVAEFLRRICDYGIVPILGTEKKKRK